ncbi:MAG: hypothetical protein ACETWM_15955 [Candidatus Lokiarchaeia archaeon]
MFQGSQKGFILIGCIGGLYAIIIGFLIMVIGVSIQGNIILYMGVSTLFPILTEQLFAFLSTIFRFSGSLTLGPIGSYFVGTIIWDINTFGIIVSVHGFVMLLSTIGAWTGNKWYAAILAIFGLMGLFAFFNFGSILGLLSGIILWYSMK